MHPPRVYRVYANELPTFFYRFAVFFLPFIAFSYRLWVALERRRASAAMPLARGGEGEAGGESIIGIGDEVIVHSPLVIGGSDIQADCSLLIPP